MAATGRCLCGAVRFEVSGGHRAQVQDSDAPAKFCSTACYIGRVTARGHLSLRPTRATLERLERRARQSAQPKTSLAERYLAEGLEMDDFPGIHFVDDPLGRRPALIGTGLDVWEVVETVKAGDGSISEAAAYLEIDPAVVERAVRYYGTHREEIDAWIARVHEIADEEERKWLSAREALGETPPR